MGHEYIDLLTSYINVSDPNFHINFTNCMRTLQDDPTLVLNNTDFWLEPYSATQQECLKTLLPRNQYSSPFVLPVWQQVIWSVVFAVMVFVAACGNAIVVWIVLAHQRMRTVTNYFLLNLAFADLMMSVLNTAFNFVYLLDSNWLFDGNYCTVNNFVANMTVASSVFSISAMSIDRYFAIVHPLSPRMPRRKAVVVMVIIWVSAGLLALPNLLYSVTRTYRYPDRSLRTICFLLWPDGPSGVSHQDYVYNILFLVLTYLTPMVCMAITYSFMCSVLWGSKSIGVVTERQNQSIRAKRRVVRMLVTVVIIFGTCWLPYHIYFLYTYHNPDVIHSHYVQHVFLAIYLLAMSNSMYNPLVYYSMNSRFRNYFNTILCCCRHRQIDQQRSFKWSRASRFTELRRSWSSTHASLRRTLSTSLNSRKPFLENKNPTKIVSNECFDLRGTEIRH